MANEKQKGHLKISELAKLKKLMDFMKNADPMTAENKFFSMIGCKTEKDKIDFEVKYILSELLTKSEEHKKNISNYDEVVELLNIILQSINEFRPKDIPIIKRYFIVIELKLGMTISFLSEVENVYNSNMQRLKEELNKKTKDFDYIANINEKDILIENNKNDNKKYKDYTKNIDTDGKDYLKNNKKKGL